MSELEAHIVVESIEADRRQLFGQLPRPSSFRDRKPKLAGLVKNGGTDSGMGFSSASPLNPAGAGGHPCSPGSQSRALTTHRAQGANNKHESPAGSK